MCACCFSQPHFFIDRVSPPRFLVSFLGFISRLPPPQDTGCMTVAGRLTLSTVVALVPPPPPPFGSLDREKRNAVTSATARAASDDVSVGGAGGRDKPGSSSSDGDCPFTAGPWYVTPHTNRHLATSCNNNRQKKWGTVNTRTAVQNGKYFGLYKEKASRAPPWYY